MVYIFVHVLSDAPNFALALRLVSKLASHLLVFDHNTSFQFDRCLTCCIIQPGDILSDLLAWKSDVLI